MKKFIYLFLLMSASALTHAQDHQLYKFSLKETGHYLTYDLHELGLQEKCSSLNELSQLFILKRDIITGKVLIASAADPTLFLKRDGSGVVLSAYQENAPDLYWDLRYVGYPYGGLTDLSGAQWLSWEASAGLQMETISSPLTGNEDASGDHFRFQLEKVANAF